MNKITMMLSTILIFAIVIGIYMQISISSNTTGWQPIMISTVQQYLPLLAVVAVIIFVIGVFSTKKG